jgi:hypothetical protein
MASSRLVLLSATLSDDAIRSILSEFSLDEKEVNILRSPNVRPNVALHVQLQRSVVMRDRYERIFRLIRSKHMGEKVVVFVTSRKDAESIANGLAKNGLSAAFYHGGMDSDERELVLDLFNQDFFQVIVATEAFGLGIDAGFSFAIIEGGARTIEAGVQLSGRVGRNKMCSQATFVLNAELYFRAYRLIIGDFDALDAYGLVIKMLFVASGCLQCALGIWDESVCGSCSCLSRCDLCLGIAAIGFNLDLAAAANTVIGGDGLGGVLGDLKKRQERATFSSVVKAWVLEISEGGDGSVNADLPFDLVPSALLLLCAFEFIEPELEEQLERQSFLVITPASPRLARRLYQDIAEGRVDSPLPIRGFK